MQLTTLAPAALLALISMPVAGATAVAPAPDAAVKGKLAQDATPAKPSSDADVVSVLRQMDELLQMGQPIDASVKDLRKIVDALPSDADEHKEMAAAVDALAHRAANAFVEPVDISVIRQQFYWARVNAAMERTASKAKAQDWTTAQFSDAVQPVTGGGLTVYIPWQARRIQGQVREAFVHTEQFASTPEQLLILVQLDTIQGRLEQALQLLRYRARTSNMAPGDYDAILRLLVQRARLMRDAQLPS